MKKQGIIVLFLLLAATISAASIDCVVPRQGDVLFQRQTYRVIWMKHGDMQDRVRIILTGERLAEARSGMMTIRGQKGLLLAEEVKNTHYQNFFYWTVSEAIPAGEYRLLIMTMDEQVMGEGPVFSIRNAENQPEEPDLTFSEVFFIGDKYQQIPMGGVAVFTPDDLSDFYRDKIVYDAQGKAVSTILPFAAILKNAGNSAVGVSELRITISGRTDMMNQDELKPGEESRQIGSHTQLMLDLNQGRTFEVVLVIDPANKLPDRDRRNNRFFFTLETRNF